MTASPQAPRPPLDVDQADLGVIRRETLQQLVTALEYDDYLHVTADGLDNDCHDDNDLTASQLLQDLRVHRYVLLEELEGQRYCSFHGSVSAALNYAVSGFEQWEPLWVLDLDARTATRARLRAVLDEDQTVRLS